MTWRPTSERVRSARGRAERGLGGGERGRGVRRSVHGHRVERGFTLIEALIALVIIGLTVVATIEAFGAGLRAQREVDGHLDAVALAEARMDELALLSLDSMSRYAEPREGVFAPPFGRYRWRAEAREVAGSPALRRVVVTVGWDAGSYTLATAFYYRGRRSDAPAPPAAPGTGARVAAAP
jgi:prepilin-type N-terminal cleavage/methylation domain-containing protein